MPTQESTRTARIGARIAPDASAVVRHAAELQGRSISYFLVGAALKNAHQTIADAQLVRLSVDDQQRLVDLLLNPPPLAPAMQRALHAREGLACGVDALDAYFASQASQDVRCRAGACRVTHHSACCQGRPSGGGQGVPRPEAGWRAAGRYGDKGGGL